ncbi:MAG TPA: sulfite exporter TauE/SafE family protein [Acidimicrobiia bacterium]|nr:sulfite exporter TauE/SafE family protein [Acidimicrobiia bacterium]
MTETPRRHLTWWLVATGVVTGVLAGLLGVGGGIIMVPAMTALGFSRHRATGSSLAAILLVAVAATVAFGAAGDVDVGTAVALGLGGLVGSTLGAHWMNRLSGVTLARIFGVVLLAAGARMLLAGDVSGTGMGLPPIAALLVGVAVGILTGLLSGLAGVGGGIIMVPAMVLFLGMDQHAAEGTSLLAMMFTAAAGTRVNAKNKLIDWRAMLILGVAGAVVAPLAAGFAQQIPALTLGRLFGAFVLINAFRTLWKSRTPPITPA